MTKTALSMVRGDTAVLTYTAKLNDVAISLTGGKAWFTARRSYTSTTAVFAKDSASNGIVLDADQVAHPGKFVVTISPTDTASLPDEVVTLVFDVQAKTSDGTVVTVAIGTISIEPDVTVVTS